MCRRSAAPALHGARQPGAGLDRGGRASPAGGIRFCLAWREASRHKPTHRASAVPRRAGQRRASLQIILFALLMHGGHQIIGSDSVFWEQRGSVSGDNRASHNRKEFPTTLGGFCCYCCYFYRSAAIFVPQPGVLTALTTKGWCVGA